MNANYFIEGYNLMIGYMKKNRILTKERNFRRRLDNFYKKHKDEKVLSLEDEQEYLQLEKYFFNEIAPATTNEEKALQNTLNILASVDVTDKKGD